jgi:signal transduction histidine kinase
LARTLTAKLVLALMAMLLALGLAYVAFTAWTTHALFQEITQRLNQSLAANLVHEDWLMRGGEVNREALESTFHTLMVVNPAIEVYLVDPGGRIRAYSAPPGEVELERIDLGPVRRFLGEEARLPILGDDPRQRGRRKVFSAAPVFDQGRLQGYLYVVLGGEAYDSVARMLEGSYVVRLSMATAALALVLALVVGMLGLRRLTARLVRLHRVMDGFKRSDFREPVTLPRWRRDARGDEIDRLGLTFEQMSHRIIDQVRQLHQSDASRREMVANVSHDLRTPLASLQGYLETLVMKEDRLSEADRRECLSLALKHSRRLGRLIEELFELATLDSRDTRLHSETFSLGELVQDVAQQFRPEAQSRGLRLETRIPEATTFVSGDIGLVERLLENLIENAIKYTPAGGTVSLSLEPGEDGVLTRVADTGRGIARKDVGRVFERFYRGDGRHAGAPEGVGLGLAIASRIVQLHGSTIDVDSAPGRGTTFSFRLPPARGT